MKNKHFYESLIETTDITLELADLDLTPKERVHLKSLVDAQIHSVVIKTVLSNLPQEDKKTFLANLVGGDHSKTWTHLQNTKQDIEEILKKEIEKAKKELLKDLAIAKNLSGK